MTYQYKTTHIRVILALIAGAALGAVGWQIDFYIYDYPTLFPLQDYLSIRDLSKTFIFLLLYITILGGSLWLVLHRLGYRQLWAVTLAFVLVPGLVMLFLDLRLAVFTHPHRLLYIDSWGPLVTFTCMGMLIWRVAYHRI